MDTHDSGANVSNDATVIRGVLPGNTAKRLARLADISVETARTWLYRRLSASRRRELALALLAEMDREDVARTALRRRLAEWASGGADGSLDRAGDGMDRSAAGAAEEVRR